MTSGEDGPRVVDREAAVRVVEEELERERQKWSALGVDPVRVVVAHVREHELVWLVSCQSEEFVRTGDSSSMLIGSGPYLVDRVDGGLHVIGAVSAAGGEWEADYRVRIRGLAVRTAVDDLHDEIRELAAERGRVHAVRALRQRLPVLSPAGALQYVNGLLDGDAPAHLVAVAVEQLVGPVDPVVAVKTIRPGRPVSR
ncbi:YrhB domain-containing protein [Streptomyces sp. NPDC020898]|uniref:YrhB domain-containing protein n=1 Tax=Streptomyces sp. NPDC020898 TaxID=3365101 RepID=UPI00378FB77E